MTRPVQLEIVPQSRPSREEFWQRENRLSQRARLSIERALETSEGREYTRLARVHLACMWLLAYHGKGSEAVFLAQINKHASFPDDAKYSETAGFLRTLNERGSMLYRPSTRPKQPSWIGLPELETRAEPVQSPLVADLSAPPSEVDLEEPEGGALSADEMIATLKRLGANPALVRMASGPGLRRVK